MITTSYKVDTLDKTEPISILDSMPAQWHAIAIASYKDVLIYVQFANGERLILSPDGIHGPQVNWERARLG